MIHSLSPRRAANFARILDAALELVARDGLDGLSMHAVAAAAGYTPGALYRYVESKEDLLAALTLRVIDGYAQALATVDTDLPAGDRVVALVDRYVTLAIEAPNRFALVAVLLAEPRVVLPDRDHAAPALAAMIAALSPVVTALGGAAEGTTRALSLFGAVTGVLLLRKQSRHAPARLDVSAMARDTARALVRGWGLEVSS